MHNTNDTINWVALIYITLRRRKKSPFAYAAAARPDQSHSTNANAAP